MSESINDTAKEGSNGLKDIIAKRFGGVLPAYVATSWLAFNWSNIALLFMSKATVEQRIQAIYGIPYLYGNYLIFPVVVGILLALVTPAAEWYVAKLTSNYNSKSKWAQQLADQTMEKVVAFEAEQKILAEGRVAILTGQIKKLENDVKELTEKSDGLLRSVTSSYDSIISSILRANYLQDKLYEFRPEGDYTPDEVKKLFDNTFPEFERIRALKRRALIEASEGPTAVQALYDGVPLPLETKPELVKELLFVTGMISQDRLNSPIEHNDASSKNNTLA